MDINLEMLEELNTLSIFLRLSLALISGGIIGLERSSKKRAAGFRTYMLVCVGATLVMITNQYIYMHYPNSDPARLGAQVINGIGFLGAGTIIVTRHHQVIGLTTAAGLWASACMGLAIGIGFYQGALMSGIFIFLIITVLNRIDHKVGNKARNMELYIEFKQDAHLSDFYKFAQKHGIFIEHVEFSRTKYDDNSALATIITIKLPKRQPHIEILENIQNIHQVAFVEEI